MTILTEALWSTGRYLVDIATNSVRKIISVFIIKKKTWQGCESFETFNVVGIYTSGIHA